MARKPTKTEIREQARRDYEARQRAKSYAILKIENERGWGFVSDCVPQIIKYLVPNFDVFSSNYSCEALAFDTESVEHWADRVRATGCTVTVIPVAEKWDDIRYNYGKVPMAQRYAA